MAAVITKDSAERRTELAGDRTIFAAGLTLLVLTLVFNVAGYIIRKRYREAYE